MPMKQMTKWERVKSALSGADVDRVPISLWKHYHLQDRAPGQLAAASVTLHRQFDTDLIKLTPSGLYPIQDWGATIQFGTTDDDPPLAVQPVITSAEGWESLPRLDVSKGALQREIEMIHLVARALEGSAPFMMTLFSPLTIAYKLCGARVSGNHLVDHLRDAPRQLHAGLATIADVVRAYAAACLDAGASGIFYATQMATTTLLTAEEFAEFGKAYDLDVLEPVVGRSQVTMLHVCGPELLFDQVVDYPIDTINWAASTSGTTLSQARGLTDKPLAGGLSLDTLLHGTEADVTVQARAAIAEAGPNGLILAPDCVIKGPSPDANLAAARRAVEGTGSG
jgi:uroporphyrinogen decarboxylase